MPDTPSESRRALVFWILVSFFCGAPVFMVLGWAVGRGWFL